MSDRTLRFVVTGLAAALVVVLVAIALVMSTRGGSPVASATASPSATASLEPGASPSDGLPSPSAEASLDPGTSPEASPSASPSGSPLPAPLATLTLLQLKLDAAIDPDGLTRTVTFRSDGPGAVSVKLASTAPKGTTHMCLIAGKKEVGCNDIASGSFKGTTTQEHVNWHVTLRGNGANTPTVNLTVTFQALTPSVKVAHARFDGTDYSETNGIQARITARTPGFARVLATWGGHPFLYEVDLFDESFGIGDANYPNQGPATNVDLSSPIDAGDWRIVLENIEGGFGATDMTATIFWP